MMNTTICNTEDVIDSRDVIARIEELEEMIADYENPEGILSLHDEHLETKAELAALRALADEAEDSSDWIHGEQLIRRSYFVNYIAEMIDDCYELPKEMKSDKWPYCHMTIDYEAAAEHAEQDYISVYFDGVEYLIRSV